jgi:hypothetical protein
MRETSSSRSIATSINTQLSDKLNATDLLNKEAVIPFAGLTPVEETTPPESLSQRSTFHTSTSRTLKDVLALLPDAAHGELYAENRFVGNDGTPDTEKIKSQTTLDIQDLKKEGIDIDSRADRHRGQLDTVSGYTDIRDPRREALAALGFDVEYRWQIATDRYSIIQPSTTLMRAISTLQMRDYTDVYGAISLRQWGGSGDVYIFFPSLEVDLDAVLGSPDSIEGLADAAEEAMTGEPASGKIGDRDPTDYDPNALPNTANQTVHLGLCANYSHSGTSVFRVTDTALIPDEGAMFYSNLVENRRRHDGSPDDDAHERDNDRVPISEWWDKTLSALENAQSRLPELVARARKTVIDFSAAPYTVDGFYTYLGLPETYAEQAATIAQRVGYTSTIISLWGLYVGLSSTLTADYGGSFGSQAHKRYYDKLARILTDPADTLEMINQSAELDAADNPDSMSNADLTHIDTLADVTSLPEITSEADISETEAVEITETVSTNITDYL